MSRSSRIRLPNLRATRVAGRRVWTVPTDRVARRTMRQKRVLVRNRITRMTEWMDENGVGHFHFDEDSVTFESEGDATLFYLAFV